MQPPKYPSLYQINTRVRLTDLSNEIGRTATLDDIPDSELDGLAAMGFDWVWYLSVWTTGVLARKVSLENPDFRRDFEATLPDLQEQDIGGSGFAIVDYKVHPGIGGDEALKRLRARLQQRGLKLMLDFVPNHMGPDHPWVEAHPEYFVAGTEEDLEKSPQNYTRVKRKNGDMILAYGRDPYFAGWPDTVQLDYSNPATVEAMGNELLRISRQCDGVRCDMSMLVLPHIFERTWGRKAQPFWPIITKAVREQSPGFCFMAEVYWEMEWELQQQGFDYTYDKRLYDRLTEGHARPVREHFYAGLDYQDKLARFLENHDEPRAAATFENKNHEAAAIITFFSPGLRFFHQGQFEGKKKRISPHLVRGPKEPVDTELQSFYARLLHVMRDPVFRDGQWRLLECTPAWDGNGSWDSFIAFSWEGNDGKRMLVAVNYAPHDGQCYLHIPIPELAVGQWRLQDLMGEASYDRDGNDMLAGGLYLDLQPWQYHIFEIKNYTNESNHG
ncbi:alpha-amylase family glycosyl hydrolase [Flavihumibacter fluvii]|uniref:alpha-amylase family glycosyl hydrolase n=1 Tax=Flavihumibacter fluvii TaxID=2838157 RepID=UPI001BDEAFE1|nr:alpha-amylase family glycosyl hydrolase [Flavihumibacter fluvii]ULQ54120.1 alpha-amylase family glycosyl hydrolase [Flavihumibacter fluvii]